MDNSADVVHPRKLLTWQLFVVMAIFVSVVSVCIILSYVRRVSDAVTMASAVRAAESRTLAIREFRTLYSSEVVKRVKPHGIAVTHDYKQKDRSIPLPATLTIMLGNRLSCTDSQDEVRLYSAYPFPWRANRAPLDAFEQEALRRFSVDASKPYYTVEEGEHGMLLRYATADVMRESCIACHNSHPDTPKNDWRLGDVRGVVSTTIDLNPLAVASTSELHGVLVLLVVMAVVGCVLFVTVLIWQTKRASREARSAANYEYSQQENVNLEKANEQLRDINRALEDARAEAIVATKAKSNFLANMSHEIRTPMTAILGFSESLRGRDLSEAEARDCIDTIHKNGEHLLGLINDVLDVSKIEAGKLEVETIPCSPHTVVEEVVALMKVCSDAKKIAFNTEYIGQLPETIQSDPMRLKQILINIVGNAIKFTDEGGVRLITRFIPGNEYEECGRVSEQCLQFDILDTGVGMTKEQASKLFQPFTQADSTMTRKFGGTGLGLTISKELAKLLGGNISIVDSEPRCGTRFRTTITTGPLVGVKMVDSLMATSTPETAPPPENLCTGKPLDCRVLLAEDGPDNQRLISFILKKAGAEVIIAENGQIAVDEATAAISQGKPFDVILMDMQMPVLDGYKATMALRNQGYEGPIIALTAHAMASDREKCINSGCDDYTTKPIDRTTLIQIIQSQLLAVRH